MREVPLYGAVASCYAYAVMLRRPSLPEVERFYTYYLLYACLAFIFPVLFIFPLLVDDVKLLPNICCQCVVEKYG